MKQRFFKSISLLLTVMLMGSFAGCSQQSNAQPGSSTGGSSSQITVQQPEDESEPGTVPTEPEDFPSASKDAGEQPPEGVTQLTVRFGDAGAPFTLYLYDNETAAAIARHVGTADWRLPIYNYDNFEHWEVMQYYDIPSRYEIPSNPETITQEAGGTVYYSDPNRIVLFYREAQVSGDYTPVGYFDDTEEFVTAVEENPVLEGWGNKIVQISSEE